MLSGELTTNAKKSGYVIDFNFTDCAPPGPTY